VSHPTDGNSQGEEACPVAQPYLVVAVDSVYLVFFFVVTLKISATNGAKEGWLEGSTAVG